MEGENSLNTSLQSKSVVERIVEQITTAIMRGELQPGDKIPTEASLCASFQVGRNSVREAIKILEAYGVVYIKRAEGTFINDCYSQKMLDPMLYGILLKRSSYEEIIELRKVLESGILKAAMEKYDKEKGRALIESFEELQRVVRGTPGEVDNILEADIRFHMAITGMIENEMLSSVYSYVVRITTPSRTRTVEQIIGGGLAGDFIRMHENIMEAIRNKQEDRIGEILDGHYIFWQQNK